MINRTIIPPQRAHKSLITRPLAASLLLTFIALFTGFLQHSTFGLPPLPGNHQQVLTNPPPGEVAQLVDFSPTPTKEEISDARIFEDPLMAIWDEPTAQENKLLADALIAFSKRSERDDFSSLEGFLSSSAAFAWYPSVLAALGSEYYHTGFYSKALDAWEEAWLWTQFERSGGGKILGDRVAGELARMHARIGGFQRLHSLFGEIGNRKITGAATERLTGAKQAQWLMENKPEIAFRCGPLALYSVKKFLNPSPESLRVFMNSASSQKGFSLKQLNDLAQGANFDSLMAHRPTGAGFAVPSVVHWKVGHYAAVLKHEGDLFWVVDPTFGDEGMWISQKALEQESSGYFVVPGRQLPAGWNAVSAEEGDEIFGKGVTTSSNPNQTTPQDVKQNPDCLGGSSGMATYNFHLMLVSLNIEDTPLSFQPPRGRPINIVVTYNQREANQPSTFNYSNFGQKWTCNWISYLTDSGPNIVGDVQFYVGGGGTETFTGYDTNTATFSVQPRIQATLKRTSTNSYEMRFPDGSIQIFAQPDGSVGSSRKVFLTQVIDSTGYTNSVLYDSQLRISMVTDPAASRTNLVFEYDGSDFAFNPTTIRKITDRYGRYVTFNYDEGGGQLKGIIDVIGLESKFSYSGTFITGLETPYGKTVFEYGEDGRTRWLEATDPLGQKSRAEYTENPATIANADPDSLVPQGIYRRNTILNARNTFYWDKKAMHEAGGDYSKARVYHWQHGPNWASAIGTAESYKEPLENRVWFNYPGQVATDEGATLAGTLNLPSKVARVLDDGTTQLWTFLRNSFGFVTNAIDPVGRTFSYIYSTNGIDLLEIRQTRGANNELIASYSYNTQHLPLTAKDAAGQITKFGYNAYGQLTFVTNALQQITAFNYDVDGRLKSIDGPQSGTNDTVSFDYDAFDRIRTITDSDGYAITTDFDSFGRALTNSFPDGTFETFTYQYLDPDVYTDRGGRTTKTVYNAVRQLVEIRESTNWVVGIDYCDCGNISSMVDPLGRKTQWLYDVQGRVTSKVYPDNTHIDYTYEKTTSRLLTIKNARGQTRTNVWGFADSLLAINYANPHVAGNVTFNYDTNYTRLTSVSDEIGTTSFEYYPITTNSTIGAGMLKAIDGPLTGTDDRLVYSYDELGRIKSELMYNSSGSGFLSYSNVLSFDVLGRLTNAVNALGPFTYSYAAASTRLTNISYPNGIAIAYSYYGTTNDLRLKEIINGNLYSKFSYAYNVAGQVTNWMQLIGGGSSNSFYFAYDQLDQMTNVTLVVGGTTNYVNGYTYDLAGNRRAAKLGATTYNSYFGPDNDVQLAENAASQTRQYEWDEEDRLRAIVEGSARTEFFYNAFGRLALIYEKSSGSLVKTRVLTWSGDKIAEERVIYQSTGSAVLRENYNEGYIDTWWQVPIYVTKDHLGSVREAISSVGIETRYSYDEFGTRTLVSSRSLNPSVDPEIGFTGLYTRNGLALALHRAYDSDLGRWISRDPIAEAGGLNLYRYAENNPINLTDIYGLCPNSAPMNSVGGSGNGPPRPPKVASSAAGSPGGGGSGPGRPGGGSQPRDASGRFLPKGPGQSQPGSSAVNDFAARAKANGFDIVGEQVHVNTPFGTRILDLAVRNRATGKIGGVELKSSRSAFERFDAPARQQAAADRYINSFGGQGTGKNSHLQIDNVIKVLWP